MRFYYIVARAYLTRDIVEGDTVPIIYLYFPSPLALKISRVCALCGLINNMVIRQPENNVSYHSVQNLNLNKTVIKYFIMSEKANFLWNGQSLKKNYSYTQFYKTTPFLSFQVEKEGQNSSIFLV